MLQIIFMDGLRNRRDVVSALLAASIPRQHSPVKDPIDSRQLQIFVALARKGSLRAAAAELFLTNSAISHSIHALETSLDTKLFHRPGKFLELTVKGQYLLKEAPNILNSMDRVRLELAGDDSLPRSSLRVAVGHSLISHLLPEVQSEWELCFPDSKLVAKAAERDACLKWLNDDVIDVAVLVDPPTESDFKVEHLFEDELHLVVEAGSPLAKLEAVNLRSLHAKTFLTSRLQGHKAQMVISEMRRNGFSFHDCIELGGIEEIFEMVKLGTGVTMQPNWLIERRRNDRLIVSRPLSNVHMIRRWGLVSGGNKELNLLRLCRRFADNLFCGVAKVAAFAAICLIEDYDGLWGVFASGSTLG